MFTWEDIDIDYPQVTVWRWKGGKPLPGPMTAGLILGLRRANERRRYFVTTSLIGRAQT